MPSSALSDDLQRAKLVILRHFAKEGGAPTRLQLAPLLGMERQPDRGGAPVDDTLVRLGAAREIVLRDDGEILMVMPFSAVPTPHRVVGPEQEWFANCAWDALGIAAALDIRAEVVSQDPLGREPIELSVDLDGPKWELDKGPQPVAHFAIPAALWWHDIVDT